MDQNLVASLGSIMRLYIIKNKEEILITENRATDLSNILPISPDDFPSKSSLTHTGQVLLLLSYKLHYVFFISEY